MTIAKFALLACTALAGTAARAEEDRPGERSEIVVTGALGESMAGTKTDTSLVETPQPVTVARS